MVDRVKRSIRIDKNIYDEMVLCAKKEGVTQTDFMENAISSATQMPDKSNTPDKVLSVLEKELEVKNKQIADLSAALLAAQDTAKAAQALHAANVQDRALESSEQKETRWSRLKSAWRG